MFAEPNQQRFKTVLDSSRQFNHGVIVLQHDIYNEAVNLAIGYTLPYALNLAPPNSNVVPDTTSHPPFKLQPVMQCLGRPMEDAYSETNTNPDVFGSGDNFTTRDGNLDQGTGTGTGGQPTPTTTVHAGARLHAGGALAGGFLLVIGGLVGGLLIV